MKILEYLDLWMARRKSSLGTESIPASYEDWLNNVNCNSRPDHSLVNFGFFCIEDTEKFD